MTKIAYSGVSGASNQHCMDFLMKAGIRSKTVSHLINKFLTSKNDNQGWVDISSIDEIHSQVDESSINYILFYSSPEYYLANNLVVRKTDERAEVGENNVKLLLSNWLKETENTLEFYLSNMAGSLLVNTECCVEKINILIEKINKKFNCKLTKKIESNKATNECNYDSHSVKINQCLSLNRLIDNYECQEIYEEIVSAADLLTEGDCSFDSRVKLQLNKSTRSLDVLTTRLITLENSNNSFSDKNKNLENQAGMLTSQNKELSSKNKRVLTQMQQLKHEMESETVQRVKIESQKEALAKYQGELESENELALLQVNQLSEEMEIEANRRVIIESLNEELVSKKIQLVSENKLSLLRMNLLQEELEAIFNQHSELERQSNKMEEVLKDQQCENEVALLQIQQLQEELELYFRKFQTSGCWEQNRAMVDVRDKRFGFSLELRKRLRA